MRRVGLLAIALILVGCSGSKGAAPTPTTTVVASGPTASQLVADLVSKIPTAQSSITFTKQNDPDGLLGRPGGYASGASFTDSRIDPSKVEDKSLGSAQLGGSIEVFPTAAEAVTRGQSILNSEQNSVEELEYDYTSGGVLLRIGARLLPDAALAYANALASFTGEAAATVPNSSSD